MSSTTDQLLLLLLLLISSTSFDLSCAQQRQFTYNPTPPELLQPCNQPLMPLSDLYKGDVINDLAERQTIGNFPTYPFGWPSPSSPIPLAYPIPSLSTGRFDLPWRDECDQSPILAQPSPIVPPMRLPNWPYWDLEVCSRTPARIGQQLSLDVNEDDDDEVEDVNINFNTNTNVKDPRFLQAILRNLKGTVDNDGIPILSNQ